MPFAGFWCWQTIWCHASSLMTSSLRLHGVRVLDLVAADDTAVRLGLHFENSLSFLKSLRIPRPRRFFRGASFCGAHGGVAHGAGVVAGAGGAGGAVAVGLAGVDTGALAGVAVTGQMPCGQMPCG